MGGSVGYVAYPVFICRLLQNTDIKLSYGKVSRVKTPGLGGVLLERQNDVLFE